MQETDLIPYHAVSVLGTGRVLVLAAHPDDEAFGCGGAILRHVAAGDPVHVVVVTDGAFSTDPDMDLGAYARCRRQESIQAAGHLGYGEPEFWDYPDRGLAYGEELVSRILAQIQGKDIDWLYAPSVYEIHPDHRALALSAMEAVRRCESDCYLAMYEIGNPLMPNRLLDTTEIQDQKRSAWSCFTSQLAVQDYIRHIDALHTYRTYTLGGAFRAAEAYYVTNGSALRHQPLGLYQMLVGSWRNAGVPIEYGSSPLVSVIVRFRGGTELREALDSIAAQTYDWVEVLVVDTTGRGLGTLGNWCGRFPLRQVAGKGPFCPSRAANLGLEAAAGAYIIFLEENTWYFPDHLSLLVAVLESDPGAIGAYSGVECVEFKDSGRVEVGHSLNEPYDPIRLQVEDYLSASAVLLRRRVLESGCRFDEALGVHQDWDFWLQCQRLGPFRHLERITAACRVTGGQHGIRSDAERAEHGELVLFAKWRAQLGPTEIQHNLTRLRYRVAELDRTIETTRQTAQTEVKELRQALSASQDHAHTLAQAIGNRAEYEPLAAALDALRQQVDGLAQQMADLSEAIHTGALSRFVGRFSRLARRWVGSSRQ